MLGRVCMWMRCPQGQKWESQPPELELLAVVRSLMWVLGKEPKSSERTFTRPFSRRYTKHIYSPQIGGYSRLECRYTKDQLREPWVFGVAYRNMDERLLTFASAKPASAQVTFHKMWECEAHYTASRQLNRLRVAFPNWLPWSKPLRGSSLVFASSRQLICSQCLSATLSLLW